MPLLLVSETPMIAYAWLHVLESDIKSLDVTQLCVFFVFFLKLKLVFIFLKTWLSLCCRWLPLSLLSLLLCSFPGSYSNHSVVPFPSLCWDPLMPAFPCHISAHQDTKRHTTHRGRISFLSVCLDTSTITEVWGKLWSSTKTNTDLDR